MYKFLIMISNFKRLVLFIVFISFNTSASLAFESKFSWDKLLNVKVKMEVDQISREKAKKLSSEEINQIKKTLEKDLNEKKQTVEKINWNQKELDSKLNFYISDQLKDWPKSERIDKNLILEMAYFSLDVHIGQQFHKIKGEQLVSGIKKEIGGQAKAIAENSAKTDRDWDRRIKEFTVYDNDIEKAKAFLKNSASEKELASFEDNKNKEKFHQIYNKNKKLLSCYAYRTGDIASDKVFYSHYPSKQGSFQNRLFDLIIIVEAKKIYRIDYDFFRNTDLDFKEEFIKTKTINGRKFNNYSEGMKYHSISYEYLKKIPDPLLLERVKISEFNITNTENNIYQSIGDIAIVVDLNTNEHTFVNLKRAKEEQITPVKISYKCERDDNKTFYTTKSATEKWLNIISKEKLKTTALSNSKSEPSQKTNVKDSIEKSSTQVGSNIEKNNEENPIQDALNNVFKGLDVFKKLGQ
jgi:hypothetical protein